MSLELEMSWELSGLQMNGTITAVSLNRPPSFTFTVHLQPLAGSERLAEQRLRS